MLFTLIHICTPYHTSIWDKDVLLQLLVVEYLFLDNIFLPIWLIVVFFYTLTNACKQMAIHKVRKVFVKQGVNNTL